MGVSVKLDEQEVHMIYDAATLVLNVATAAEKAGLSSLQNALNGVYDVLNFVAEAIVGDFS